MNDRGTIKWTSIMMPEHIQMLKELAEEDNWKSKPILDEQLKVEIDMMLQVALNDDLTIKVTYFANHDHLNVKGNLLMIDSLKRVARFDDGMEIHLDDIIDVTIL